MVSAPLEVEHVLASQCLVTKKMKNMRVTVDGTLGIGVTAKDVVLAIIGEMARLVVMGMLLSLPARVSRYVHRGAYDGMQYGHRSGCQSRFGRCR